MIGTDSFCKIMLHNSAVSLFSDCDYMWCNSLVSWTSSFFLFGMQSREDDPTSILLISCSLNVFCMGFCLETCIWDKFCPKHEFVALFVHLSFWLCS